MARRALWRGKLCPQITMHVHRIKMAASDLGADENADKSAQDLGIRSSGAMAPNSRRSAFDSNVHVFFVSK